MLPNGVLALTPGSDSRPSEALDGLEGFGSRVWRRLQGWRRRCLEELGKPAVRGSAGLLVLLCGGHFKHAAVVFHSLEGVQLEQLRAQCGEVAAEYRLARDRLDESGVGVDFVLVPPGPDLMRAAVAADHRAVLASVQRLQTSLIAQVAAALNGNTSRLLLGLELGRQATEAVGDRLESLLLGPVEDDQAPGAEERRVWHRLAIDAACTAAGVAVAWALRGWAALWTTCSLGAQLCIEALDGGLELGLARRPEPLACILAALSFAYQARYWGRPPLPFPLWILTAPARVLELGLVALA